MKIISEENKGITLIALVITIIVIIILGAVSISSMTSNNIIESANEAKFKYDIKSHQEELEMYISEKYIEELGNFNPIILNKK